MFGRRASYRFLPHYQSDNRTYFVTFVTRQRFTLPPVARDITLRHIVFDHHRRIDLRVATVMPDHAHLIFTPLWNQRGETFSIGEIVKGMKGTSSRYINQALGRSGPLWMPEPWDREIRNDEDLYENTEYLLMNPVDWGLVADPNDYPWTWRQWIEGAKETTG